MTAPSEYQLLDFGRGRRLERFGDVTLDRPCPAAESAAPSDPAAWPRCTARFEKKTQQSGIWVSKDELPETWSVNCGAFSMWLRPSPFGHVGLFPEQLGNWEWIGRQVSRAHRPIRVLNLFAYTGGSTLAAAVAGAEVTHVDSARNTVRWARQNARRANLADAPIRWIAEDAAKFVRRELRRGNAYQAVVLDPPSYGHGPQGGAWKIHQHLLPLLRDCARLTDAHRSFVLLTAHSPGYGPAELSAMLKDVFFGHCQVGVVARTSRLTAVDGRRLDAGTIARWPQ